MTVRALAITVVVIFHAFTVPYGAAISIPAPTGAAVQMASIAPTLWKAIGFASPRIEHLVSIFFLIAGYFAFRAYQRSRTVRTNRSRRHFVKFYTWRRFWRMVPAFWVALAFSYLVSFDQPLSWDGLRKLAVNASLLKTLVPGYFFSINHAHWYVAVQWQIDLLYPLFLFVVARRSAGFAVAAAWTASMLFLFVVPHFTDVTWLRYFPLRWGAEWALGVYLADRHLAGVRVFRWPVATMVIAVGAIAFSRSVGVYFVEWFAVRLLLGAFYESMLLSRSRRAKWERLLAPIGICSYSLYLLHIPVQQLVASGWRSVGIGFESLWLWPFFAVISFAVAFALAKFSTLQIENRFAALGNRLWRRRWLIRQWWGSPRTQPLAVAAWCKKGRAKVGPLETQLG